jgi:hypothetical protein
VTLYWARKEASFLNSLEGIFNFILKILTLLNGVFLAGFVFAHEGLAVLSSPIVTSLHPRTPVGVLSSLYEVEEFALLEDLDTVMYCRVFVLHFRSPSRQLRIYAIK